jgi:Na+/H+-dicarboxylate symporter
MIVAPLVFTTLVVGVAKQGNAKAVGRIGGKTMLWFLCGSFISLFLGMVLVNFFQPGVNMHLAIPDNAVLPTTAAINLKDFIYHIFPSSIFDAMAKNEILQVVVFSIFFGIAAASIGEKADPVVKALDSGAHIILKMTGYIMNFAPIAVFGAMTKVFAILIGAGFVFVRARIFTMLKHIKEPALIAFSTNSSEAAFPKLMMELERFGCNEKIVSFVLPLGYSFNLDGSMMYMTFASLFIAQTYGIHLDSGTQMSMLLVLMLTSKGIAGVPRASLVVIAGTLATFKIPEAGLALLLGIDPLLDMGRAAMNVVGNSVATVVISKLEKGLK